MHEGVFVIVATDATPIWVSLDMTKFVLDYREFSFKYEWPGGALNTGSCGFGI